MTVLNLRVRRVGNSLGVTFPKEALMSLNVKEGDELFLTETAGGFLITAHDPAFADAMAAYESTKRQYRNALHELAK